MKYSVILSYTFLSSVFLFAHSAFSQTPLSWSLNQCLDEALHNAPRLQVSQESAAAAKAAAEEGRVNRWPTFGITGAYGYTSETQQIEFPIQIPSFPSPKISFGDGNVYDLAATAKVPLFSGGALLEKSRADALAYEAARQDAAADTLKLIYDVRRAYFNALGADGRVNTAQLSVQRLQRHCDELNAAMAIGTVSKENGIAAASRLRQVESALILAEAEEHAAQLLLGSVVARPDEEIIPTGGLKDALVDTAQLMFVPSDERAEVAALEFRIRQSQQLVRVSGSALLPTLSGTAAYHYGKPGVSPAKNEWMDYYTLGLNASWTLWDWQSRAHRVDQSRAALRGLQARKRDLQNALQARYRSAVTALRSAWPIYLNAQERCTLEEQRLAMVERRLKQGMATESEYLDAHNDLSAAESDLAGATVRLRLAEVDVLNAAGY
jgi:outer membrane protein